jgi:hypothetical protein
VSKKAAMSIAIEKSKPYINSNVSISSTLIPVKLLIDIDSDAVWCLKTIEFPNSV